MNGHWASWPLLILLLNLASGAQALTVIGPLDTLNLNTTLNDSVLNQGALNVVWANNVGSVSQITGSLENDPGVLRIVANDPSGGFATNSPLSVDGGIQNGGTIRFETSGSFGNSIALTSLSVGLGTTLVNLPGGLIETTAHVGVGASGNTINGQILNQGTLDHNAQTTLTIQNSASDPVGADHENAGTMNINSGSVNVQGFNSFDNSGAIRGNSLSLTGFFNNGVQGGDIATVSNSGLVDMTAGTFSVNYIDTFTNAPTGQLNVTGGNGSFVHFNSWVNQGGITIDAGRTLGLSGGVNAGVAENQSGGTIDGHGTLSIAAGTAFTNLGTIAPGSSFGTLEVLGNVTLGASGILDIEVGGTDAGVTFDQLVMASGTATLGGTLRLSFQGFAPSASDSFQIIDGAVLGLFDDVQLVGIQPGAQYSINTNSGVLLTALNDWALVPEPTTLTLGVFGLLALGFRRRRG